MNQGSATQRRAVKARGILPRQIKTREPEPRETAYANGDRQCQARRDRISQAACVVQGYREPALCAGCRFEER